MLFTNGMHGSRCVLTLALLVAAGCRTTSREVVLQTGDAAARDGGAMDVQVRETAPPVCTIAPVDKLANGYACACASECQSGFCVDGVCCSGACTGTCQRCNLPGSPGLCAPIPAGLPPAIPGQCPQEPAAGCGLDGTCDGSGGCRKYPDGAVCAPGSCEGSSVVGGQGLPGGSLRGGRHHDLLALRLRHGGGALFQRLLDERAV